MDANDSPKLELAELRHSGAPRAITRRSRLIGVEQRLLGRLRARSFDADSVLLVGFSGGTDSLALAAALGRVVGLAGVRLVLAHVDHGLRPESRSEQDRAAEIAARLALPFRRLRLDPEPTRRHPGVGIEEAARRDRYLALAALCRSLDGRCVVLAHQRDDQAETVLLHLLRGAGLAGARGMAEWGVRPVPWWGGARAAIHLSIWRPLLDEPRGALEAYLQSRGLSPIVDPTNDDVRLRRNLVRQTILPGIEGAVPGSTAALARYGRLVADDDDAMDALARRLAEGATADDGSFTLAALRDEPPAVARRALRIWLDNLGGGEIEPSAERVEALRNRAETRAGGRIDLGGGWVAIVRSGRLGLVRGGGGTGVP